MKNRYRELNEIAIKRFLKNFKLYSEEDKKIKNKIISDLKSIDNNQIDLDLCKNKLWEIISKKIIYFNREILLYIAEFVREMVCMNEFPKSELDLFLIVNEISITMQNAIFTNWHKFKSTKWYINTSNLCELRELIYLYNLLEQNTEYLKINNTKITYEEMFEPIKDEIINEYFDEYNKYFRTIKIEEETIINENLNTYLENKKLLPKHIRNSSNYALKDTLGFNLNDLNILKKNLIILKKYETLNHHFTIAKEEFFDIFSKYIDQDNLKSIVKYLSINDLFLSRQKPTLREIELRCISEQNEKLYFGLYNLRECIVIFENICFSGHYMKELGISQEDKSKFSKIQNKFSAFFSYKIADLLEFHDFVLPKKDGIIQVEICEIEISNNKKLKFKDIDVLAVDTRNKILYNFELKYFKLPMEYRRIKTDKFSNNLYYSFSDRNKILEENKDEVLQNFFGIKDTAGYKLKPVLISSRVNFNTKKDIQCYSYESFKQKLKSNEVL